MECSICLEIIENSCHGSCCHKYCYNCLIKWCYSGGSKCPMCKTTIYSIELDKEFDLINNPYSLTSINKEPTQTVVIELDGKVKPGISVKNNTNSDSKGVLISKLNKLDRQFTHLKVNDTILYINGIPCTSQERCNNIINYSHKNYCNLILELPSINDKVLNKKLKKKYCGFYYFLKYIKLV